jgi:hypothetical protein
MYWKRKGALIIMDKLPILNLRNINTDDTREFWDDIEARYPVYEGKDQAEHDRVFEPIEKLQEQVMLKLSTFPEFLSIIFDIDETEKRASEINTAGYPDNISPEFKKVIDSSLTLSFALKYTPQAKITLINSRTDEAFNIDAALSPHGNALISACGHASILSKQPDGFYYVIDPQGTSEKGFYSKACPLIPYFQRQIPPGSESGIHATDSCNFQTKRGVCFLWSIMFLCTPDLTDGKLRKIIETTFERHGEYDAEAHKRYLENFDLYTIAVMEDFVKSDQEIYKAMTAEERLAARSEAGGRRTRRRKTKRKTRHKKTRKSNK